MSDFPKVVTKLRHMLQFDPLCSEALSAVRDDTSGTNWAIVQHPDLSPDCISLVGKGSGGFEEMMNQFNSSSVQYGLLRETTKIDLSTTVKFVYIYNLGEAVPIMKKGRLGVCKGEVRNFFTPFHVDFEIENKTELTHDQIKMKIQDAAGTLDKTHDPSFLVGKQERGYTTRSQHQLHESTSLNRPAAEKKPAKASNEIVPTPSAQANATSKASQGGKIVFSNELLEAIKDVRDDNSSTRWLVGTYKGNNLSNPIELLKKGTTGVADLKECFSNDSICYALIRVVDKIDGHDTIKFAFIQWIGTDVSIMNKAKVSTHKGESFHSTMSISPYQRKEKSAMT